MQDKKTYFRTIVEALSNIFIFLPYFFSVPTLFKTLFIPWKNLKAKKTIRGFSFSEYFGRLSFNFISSMIGFAMRSSIIIFYGIVTVLYILLIPVILLLSVLYLPIHLVLNNITSNDSEIKEKLRKEFIESHTLDQNHYQAVEQWFEYLYATRIQQNPWWSIKSLFSVPPLARDWAVGFTPTLDEYTVELTKTDYQLSIRSHIIGREAESQMIERVLSQSEEANAIILGDNGVGKHTILDLFAKKIYEGHTNPLLAYKRLLKLDMEKILTKFTDSKQREEFFEQLIQEAIESKNVILFIDNFERYVSDGEGNVNLSSAIAKYATSSKIQFIGITSPHLYETYIFPNQELRPLFAKIDVAEISREKAFTILLDEALTFEKKYKLTIPYETLLAVIDKSNFFITTIPFPEKALQLLDWACAYTVQRLQNGTKNLGNGVIMPDVIDTVLTSRTHVPTTLSDKIKEKLLHFESLLQSSILGQEQAIKEISSAVRRSFLLIGKRKKPIASFLFLGPTGVGKTETAKVISSVFFGSDKNMIRFDMSLYQSHNDIGKLIGSVEQLNPGLLTNAIRENPYGLLLIDEIEKANKDLLNIFLTILDEGYFTDGYGQRVDCKNLIIVATSNAGSDEIHKMLVHQSLQSNSPAGTESLLNYLIEKGLFSPEFLNRFDGVIAYKPLGDETALVLAKNIVNRINEEMYELHKVHVEVSDETIKKLIEQGYNSQFGARNLDRVMRQQLEDTVAKLILEGKTQPDQTIKL